MRGYEPLSYDVRVFPPPLYNLGGKLELSAMVANSNLQDYITRTHDLNGRILLVLLQAEIEAHPGGSVDATVSASRHRNPYTGDSMDYDAAARTIGFDCRTISTTEICAVAL